MTIGFKNLDVSCLIGTLPHEKNTPQKLRISFSATLRSFPPIDHLDATVDYSALAALFRHICQQRHRELIETLAQDLLKSVSAHFSMSKMKLTIEKPAALVDADCAFVEFEQDFEVAQCDGH